ncbi:hypothetical protein [Nesterenkonia jeotgali]|nr:hypothetical protein [Nesterenkonia jeotgali]
MSETNFQDEVLHKLRSLEESNQRIEHDLRLIKNYQQEVEDDHTDYTTRG